MNQENVHIIVHETTNIQQQDITLARIIFINYFTNLYQNITPEKLGIKASTQAYLNTIFNKTEQAFKNQKLHLAFAYINNNVVGLTTYEFLKDERLTLIRTLPIDLLYKHKELEIRKALTQFVQEQFPTTNNVVIMVRKANKVHQTLCLQTGFKQSNQIFNDSFYISNNYDSTLYHAYTYSLLS